MHARRFNCRFSMAISIIPVFIAGVVLGVTGSARGQCSMTFAPDVDYGVGSGPLGVAVGDFNGDGKSDLVSANSQAGTVSILLGNGDGTMQPAVSFSAGVPSPYAPFVAVGHFDGDGALDLVVAIYANPNGAVAILLGNGDGTFLPPVRYAAGINPYGIAVGDFNGDAAADLVVANNIQDNPIGSLSILLGNGDGTFQPRVAYATGMGPTSVAIGDFDANGSLDLVTESYVAIGYAVTVMLGNGDGTFQAASYLPLPNGCAVSVATGDLNGDSKTDVVSTSQCDARGVFVLLGNGDGSFMPALYFNAGISFPQSVVIADFSRDGAPDLAVSGDSPGVLSILVGDGDGTFQSPVPFPVNAGWAYGNATSDFNGDGSADIAVANSNDSNVSVFLNTTPANPFPIPTITQQPGPDQMISVGQPFALSVSADGHGSPLTYQWRRDGVPLVDGGKISGAASPTLTIASARQSDTGSYDVQVVAPACGGSSWMIASEATFVTVAPRRGRH